MRLAASVIVLAVAALAGTRGNSYAPAASCPGPVHPQHKSGVRAPSARASHPGQPARSVRHARPLSGNTWIAITARTLDYVYSPQQVTVKVGARVTWVNKTAEPHTVTDERGKIFDVTADPGRSVTLQFMRAGRYPYFCRFHPYMHGVIVVTP